MQVSVRDAEGRLDELVRLARQGDEVVLTQKGAAAVRLVPVAAKPTAEEKQALMERVRASSWPKLIEGADAAHSQDFLYDEFGLPK